MTTETETTASTAVVLSVAERAVKALGLADLAQTLTDLAASTTSITVITNTAGYDQVHAARMILKNRRVEIQTAGKNARDDATKFSKAVIAEENRLVALIEPEEKRLQALQKAHEDAVEAERQAKIAAEAKRVTAIQERIKVLRGNRTLSPTSGSPLIAEHISDVEDIPVDDTFAEFAEQAAAAKAEGLAYLMGLLNAARSYEAEQARIADERAELNRLRAEQAQRDAEAKAKADEDARIAAEARAKEDAERAERIAKEDAEIAARKAELERQEKEAADRRAAIEAEERAKAAAARIAAIPPTPVGCAHPSFDADGVCTCCKEFYSQAHDRRPPPMAVSSRKPVMPAQPRDAELCAAIVGHFAVDTMVADYWLKNYGRAATAAA